MSEHGAIEKYPLVIAGASLAGISTAIRLKQLGFTPLVIDKACFPRAKLCGEFLGPDAFRSLETLDVLADIHERANNPIQHIHFHDAWGASFKIDMKWMNRETPYALSIERTRLDTALILHARRMGITVLEKTRILPCIQRIEKTRFSTYLLTLQQDNGGPELREWQLETPWLIDASGRHGGLRLERKDKLQLQEKRHSVNQSSQIGISLHIEANHPACEPDALNMYFFDGGYGGLLPLSGNRMNCCMLVSAKLAHTMRQPYEQFYRQTIGKNPQALLLLNQSQPISDFRTTGNLNLSPKPVSQQALICVGDSLVTLDPFTGSGMAVALESGILAGETIASALCQKESYEVAKARYYKAYYRRFRPRMHVLPWVRALGMAAPAQRLIFPVLKPFLPLLTKIIR